MAQNDPTEPKVGQFFSELAKNCPTIILNVQKRLK